MSDITKASRTRPTKKPALKKEETTSSLDTKSLEKNIAELSKKCEALEARCAKLEKSKAPNPAGNSDISDARWERLKLYLEKKFGRGLLKETGLWEL
jgi:hypothetical protein